MNSVWIFFDQVSSAAEVDILNGTGFNSCHVPFTYSSKCLLRFIFNLYQTYWHLRLCHCLCTSFGRSHSEINFLSCQSIFPYTSVISSTVLYQNYCLLQFVIRAPRDGQVEKTFFRVGENVSKNVVVIKFVKEGSDDQSTV
jgi:hypothetical protein